MLLASFVGGVLAVQKRGRHEAGSPKMEDAMKGDSLMPADEFQHVQDGANTSISMVYPWPPEFLNYKDPALFKGWDQTNEESWFRLDCNDMMRVAGGWRDDAVARGGTCFTYDTRDSYTWNYQKHLNPWKGVKITDSRRTDCETVVYWSEKKNVKIPGAPPRVMTLEDKPLPFAYYRKWCPPPTHRFTLDKCKEIPEAEWTGNQWYGWCWTHHNGEDAWHWRSGILAEDCTKDWYNKYDKEMTVKLPRLPWNIYYESQHVWCPAPQCMSHAKTQEWSAANWAPDPEREKYFSCNMSGAASWMCGYSRVIDGTEGLTPEGKFKTWRPSLGTDPGSGPGELYWCPKDRQVPYTEVAEDLKVTYPRGTSNMQVFTRTFYDLRCFSHGRDDCSPSDGVKSQMPWTALNWDDIDCETFLVDRRRMTYQEFKNGGVCLEKRSMHGGYLTGMGAGVGQGYVLIQQTQRERCDFGWDTNQPIDKAVVETELRQRWCPACHFANNASVCENTPQLIPQGALGWCWSSMDYPKDNGDAPDWRFRALKWGTCESDLAIMLGWVFCPAPTCKDDYTKRYENIQCTAEHVALGLCASSANGKTTNIKVATCNAGEWIPVKRGLCPNNKFGTWMNGIWTPATGPTPPVKLAPCSSFLNPFNMQCPPCKRPGTCPLRCAWSPENGCSDEAPTTTTTTETPKCSDVESEEHCRGHCQWDGGRCVTTPCGEHATEQSCPADSYCKWDGKTHKCVVRQCADHETQDTCPEKCSWEGDQCKPILPFELCEETGGNGEAECPEGCDFVSDCEECAVAAEYWMGTGKAQDYDDTLWPPRTGGRPQGCFRNKKWNIKCNPFRPGETWPNEKPKVGPKKNKYPICKKVTCETVCNNR